VTADVTPIQRRTFTDSFTALPSAASSRLAFFGARFSARFHFSTLLSTIVSTNKEGVFLRLWWQRPPLGVDY
jgi:hypothetical protein